MRISNYVLFLLLVCPWAVQADRKCFPSIDRDPSVSGDCDEISIDFIKSSVSSFIRPRSITNDLTYRNSNLFYQRFRGDASCTRWTYSATYLYQKNRQATRIGRGFFGKNPLVIAENCAPLNALNLSLGSNQPEGFCSSVRLSPERSVFAWLPQFIGNLDDWCSGTWIDLAFAVTHVRHTIKRFEQIVTPSDISGRPSANSALNQLKVFSEERTSGGVDDIQARFGWTRHYCEDDSISLYLLGSFPTGKEFDNTQYMQPLSGTRHGGFGTGLMLTNTLWDCEFSGSECVLMAEFKYLHRASHTDRRIFDLKNGPLSRFLLKVTQDEPMRPDQKLDLLKQCVLVAPRSAIEAWVALHYEYCAWSIEWAYNLWFRNREEITPCAFDFEGNGIFDMTRCTNRTTHSTARVSDPFGCGTPDTRFVKLAQDDVDFNSGAAQKALSHTLSGTICWERTWCDIPISFAFGARYEFAGSKERTSTFENWGLFGSWTASY